MKRTRTQVKSLKHNKFRFIKYIYIQMLKQHIDTLKKHL